MMQNTRKMTETLHIKIIEGELLVKFWLITFLFQIFSQALIPTLKFHRNYQAVFVALWALNGLILCCWWLIWQIRNDAKKPKSYWNPETYGYSSEITQRELSNKYRQGLDGFFLNRCVLMLLTSSLELRTILQNIWRKFVGKFCID